MANLNDFEKHIVNIGLDLYVEKASEELSLIKDENKRPLFTKEYFEMVSKQIKQKLKIKEE